MSPDDGHIAARSMWRLTNINILRKKLCTKLVYLQDFFNSMFLACIFVILCVFILYVFVVLCVYCCSYFGCRTAG